MQRLIRERPPLFDEIDAAFAVRGKPVLFAWGTDKIYAPSGVSTVQPALAAHEMAHGRRQDIYDPVGGIEKWWLRYLTDAGFRLEEEKIGHLAEFRYHCDHSSGRNQRRMHLSNVSARLSAALYRYDFTKAQAREFLENGYR